LNGVPCSEHVAYLFCSAVWDPYTQGGVQVCTQTNGVKPIMREHKLGSGVNCQGVLKEISVKQMGVQRGLVAHKLVN
jgi:hypothetical protein